MECGALRFGELLLKTLGLCPNPYKGLLEEKQRFATGSCIATAPLDRKNFKQGDYCPLLLFVQILM